MGELVLVRGSEFSSEVQLCRPPFQSPFRLVEFRGGAFGKDHNETAYSAK